MRKLAAGIALPLASVMGLGVAAPAFASGATPAACVNGPSGEVRNGDGQPMVGLDAARVCVADGRAEVTLGGARVDGQAVGQQLESLRRQAAEQAGRARQKAEAIAEDAQARAQERARQATEQARALEDQARRQVASGVQHGQDIASTVSRYANDLVDGYVERYLVGQYVPYLVNDYVKGYLVGEYLPLLERWVEDKVDTTLGTGEGAITAAEGQALDTASAATQAARDALASLVATARHTIDSIGAPGTPPPSDPTVASVQRQVDQVLGWIEHDLAGAQGFTQDRVSQATDWARGEAGKDVAFVEDTTGVSPQSLVRQAQATVGGLGH